MESRSYFKRIIIIILFQIALGSIIFVATGEIITSYKEDQEHHEQYIGEEVVINGDTLTVVNYSMWDGSYVLSNGTSVDYSLVEKN